MDPPARKKLKTKPVPPPFAIKVTPQPGSVTSSSSVQRSITIPRAPARPKPRPPSHPPPTPDVSTPDPTTEPVPEPQLPPPPKAYSHTSEVALRKWVPYRQQFLWEAYRCRGFGDYISGDEAPTCACVASQSSQASSVKAQAIYRCIDCMPSRPACRACILSSHLSNPLHRVEQWNGRSFAPSSLHSLGQCIPLGQCGSSCPKPSDPHKLTIIHLNGIHTVQVSFCQCSKAVHQRYQLLRHSWYPSSVDIMKTCATFEVLHAWHILSLTTQCTAEGFYTSLERITDFSETQTPSSKQREFNLMTHEWEHVEMLKNGGVSYDAKPIEETAPGACANLCPSCPQHGINMKEGWENEPPERQYLHQLIVSMDGNFRLQNYASSQSTAPLGPGFCIMVPPREYEPWVVAHVDAPEMSTCTKLLAIDHAHKKVPRGLRVTGVVGVICARHEFFLPNGLADLQKGERYMNIDFVLLSAVRGTRVTRITIVYDVACQWSVNFIERLKHLPSHLQQPLLHAMIDVALPKLHEKAHKSACGVTFSLNFLRGVGRTDGEGTERRWSHVDGVAPSTREMRSGHRQDTLDDVANDSNYRKMAQLGTSLLAKLKVAVVRSVETAEQYDEFVQNLPASLVQEWDGMLRAWEDGVSSATNPYLLPERAKRSQAQLEAELKTIEQAAPSFTGATTGADATSFLMNALELEDTQYALRVKVSKISPSTSKATLDEIKAARIILRQQIITFQTLQPQILPEASRHIPDLAERVDDAFELPNHCPETWDLYLPSALPASDRGSPNFGLLSRMEVVLRRDQAFDALNDLRHKIAVKAELTNFKQSNKRGGSARTRARTLVERADEKVKDAAARYTRAQSALVSLLGHGEWEKELQRLGPNDTRPINEHQDGDALPSRSGRGEGSRQVSFVHYTNVSQDKVNEGLRVEYCKTKARRDRWGEEEALLREEIARAIRFFDNRASLWAERAVGMSRHRLSLDIKAGMVANAYEQADIFTLRAVQLRAEYAAFAKVPLQDLFKEDDDAGEPDEERGASSQ